MSILAATTVTFPTSAFVPLAVGFFGLGTGYLIYGAQELFALPERSRSVDLSKLTVTSDEPGFAAVIQAGNSPSGGFEDVSGEQPVQSRTIFDLNGGKYRYYVVWITNPNGRAHINEVRAG